MKKPKKGINFIRFPFKKCNNVSGFRLIGGGSYEDFSYHGIWHKFKHFYLFGYCILSIGYTIINRGS